MRNETLILLVGDWINSADCSLVDRIVFGLLPFLILNQRSKAVTIPMLRTISGSVLASKHVLLHGMKNYVKRKGKIIIMHTLYVHFFNFMRILVKTPTSLLCVSLSTLVFLHHVSCTNQILSYNNYLFIC